VPRRSDPGRGERSYHHGNLRSAIIEAALDHIARWGPATLSLRELARQAGVSHAAPARHFRDKTALFTAIAIDGFRLLADANTAPEEPNPLGSAGLAYLRFALAHPAHFLIMNRPDLYDPEDPELIEARGGSEQGFLAGIAEVIPEPERRPAAALVARSLIHGFISLWMTSALSEYGEDVEEVAFTLGMGLGYLGEAANRMVNELPVSSLSGYRAWLDQAQKSR
jgi:AcrR family transcriptional regulator